MGIKTDKPYDSLVKAIAETYSLGRVNSFKAVNAILVITNWRIGQHIVEFEQGGDTKAQYGDSLLETLSRDLSRKYGKGFSLTNVKRFRQFYLTYPIGATALHQLDTDNQLITKGATVSHLLTWSHYLELLKIENDLERSFYEKQAVLENWSVRELQRQKQTALFLRLASGKKKNEILQLSKQGRIIEKPEDILKETYIFEFLKIPNRITLVKQAWKKG